VAPASLFTEPKWYPPIPNGGDITRHQLRDIPDADALCFTQPDSNKKSLAVNTKTPEGKQIMEQLIRKADVLAENFASGAMDRMGFSWKQASGTVPNGEGSAAGRQQ
jgi:crotonobetainyl-CoA:carnitine CoA-transferase CaiB-like acyl-CoA transferase